MVGYKNQKYIGFIHVKLDDIFNFTPAKLSFVFILIACSILKKDLYETIRTFLKFRRATQSSNPYVLMTAFSGALKIKLEKINYYSIGDFNLPQSEEKIREAVRLMLTSSALFLIFFVIPASYI